jgi:hypothetical protein
MPVTKETYSVAAPWLASAAAELLEDAFIDAGLMVSWYDSFLNGSVENRILQVVYDGTKTYGTCYYWFVISTSTIGVSVATGWNATTHVPTGTQYADFFSTATNTTANHFSLAGTLSNSTEINVVRYTSTDNPDYSWFVIRNGATPFPFMITPDSAPLVPWLDLNQVFFHHVVNTLVEASVSNADTSVGRVHFQDIYRLRRSYAQGQGARSRIAESTYSISKRLFGYSSVGAPASSSSSSSDTGTNAISVPYRLQRTGLPFDSNYTPVLFGCSYSFYVNEPLPDDFAVYFPYTSTSFSFGDSIVITAGVEEWEVLNFANNSSADAANPLFLARLI